MASGGYPGAYEKGKLIEGIGAAESEADTFVFHAGTIERDGAILTNGGRVLNVTAFGVDIPAAIDRAYRGADAITFEGAHLRRDIGQKALRRVQAS